MQSGSIQLAVLLSLVGLLAPWASGQDQPTYDVVKTSSPPTIDGQFSEEEWDLAPNEGDWKARETQSPDAFGSSFRALWDDENFYLLMRTQMGGGNGATFDDEGRESIAGGFAKTWNVYFDPNVDGEDNTPGGDTITDGYQYAVSMPEGFTAIPSVAPEFDVADFREAHIDNNWGNNGGPWSMFTIDPTGGERGQNGVSSADDNFQLGQMVSNDETLDDDDSHVITEIAIPWENFNAGNPEEDPDRDYGLFHPVAPEPGAEWFFTIGLIPQEGELPSWHNQTVGAFAARPHGVLTFVEGPGGNFDACDFDENGRCDIADLDQLLYSGLTSGDLKYDLDGSGTVDLKDRDSFLSGLSTVPGDFDLDGKVVASDLNVLGGNWQQTGLTSYAQGDANGDGVANAQDLNAVGNNWQAGAAPLAATAAVPEPSSGILVLAALLGLTVRRRAA